MNNLCKTQENLIFLKKKGKMIISVENPEFF